jgi:hypothetical protein
VVQKMKIAIETVLTETHYISDYGDLDTSIPIDIYARYCRARDEWQMVQSILSSLKKVENEQD